MASFRTTPATRRRRGTWAGRNHVRTDTARATAKSLHLCNELELDAAGGVDVVPSEAVWDDNGKVEA